jgi:hypothetical protein
MSNDRYARLGAASGIVFLVLVLAGFFVFSADAPDADAPIGEWAGWYADNEDQVKLGLTIVGVGLFFFIWFLATVRSAIASAEGGTARLASVAFGGGLIAGVFFLVAVSASAAAVLHAEAADPAITNALHDLGMVAAAPASAGFTALFAAAAIAGYRHGALPAPVAGLTALAAITQPFAYGVAATETGAFAADGVLGLWVPLVGFAIGVLALSVALIREPTPRPAVAAGP